MKSLKFCHLLLIGAASLLFASCSTTNDVVTSNAFQKRKYNKGWFVSLKKNTPKPKGADLPTALTQKALTTVQHSTSLPQPQLELQESSLNQKVHPVHEIHIEEEINATAPINPIKTDQLGLTQRLRQQDLNEVYAKWNQNQELKDPSYPYTSGKSQVVALVLCFFVGVIGVHRFYLGYIGIGIIQILTLGGCGIWALIDLILIATGSLQPIDGPYDETF
ncbi:MAG: TM2 domain-containing protein [Bacteroidota bacterium]